MPEMSLRRDPLDWFGEEKADGKFLSVLCPPLVVDSVLMAEFEEVVEAGVLCEEARGRKAPELPNGKRPSRAG